MSYFVLLNYPRLNVTHVTPPDVPDKVRFILTCALFARV